MRRAAPLSLVSIVSLRCDVLDQSAILAVGAQAKHYYSAKSYSGTALLRAMAMALVLRVSFWRCGGAALAVEVMGLSSASKMLFFCCFDLRHSEVKTKDERRI